MKPGLRRIEATLNQLHAHTAPSGQDTLDGQLVLSNQSASTSQLSVASSSTCSFIVRSTSTLQNSTSSSELQSKAGGQDTVKPFPVQDSGFKALNFPKYKVPSFSNHRHAANPGFAMGLLKEMEGIVGAWQTELQQILQQVQEIYLEGPIVDGWLESDAREARSRYAFEQQLRSAAERRAEASGATLRHADIDQLMDYIQEICAAHSPTPPQDQPRTGYRLCGLDADGQLWSRPCPAEQVPHVSLAIARYQKLRQLLGRKQYLESRLSQFAQDLIELHTKLQ